jgi:superfamily I DNA/RNA helicase
MPLVLVGDTDQLLYRFQGSKPELLTEEIDQYLSDVETIKLAINYRSQDEIIARSQQLISHNYDGLGGPGRPLSSRIYEGYQRCQGSG